MLFIHNVWFIHLIWYRKPSLKEGGQCFQQQQIWALGLRQMGCMKTLWDKSTSKNFDGQQINECQYWKEAQDVYLIYHYFSLSFCCTRVWTQRKPLGTVWRWALLCFTLQEGSKESEIKIRFDVKSSLRTISENLNNKKKLCISWLQVTSPPHHHHSQVRFGQACFLEERKGLIREYKWPRWLFLPICGGVTF